MPSPRLLAVALAMLAASGSAAQPAAPDSTRALGEVVVGAAEARGAGVERVPVAGVLTRDPVAVADVARLVPSATAPTNSRGETLLYLRGAGERQTAVLLDGAPLTVPWDRRLDLGLVPAGVVGAVDVVRGPASLAWGPNAAGGALDLVPRALGNDGHLSEAEASGGLPARGRLAATHLRRRGPWQVGVAVDAAARAGVALAEPLPFSQPDADLRTNTDRQSVSALARAAGAWDERRLAVTVLHVSAAQGVAPESHLDPDAERVRYWRIPSWRQTTLVVRGTAPVGPIGVDATAWAGRFAQTVRPFESADYESPGGDREDADRSAGGRVVASGSLGALTTRLVGSGLVSEHVRTEVGAPAETFRQSEGRVAVEAEGEVGRAQALVGVGLDAFVPLATAGRESSGAFSAPAVVGRLAVPVGGAEAWAGVARAARFPTMRELFGEALGRFALNPDLHPETTWQAEVGARVERRAWDGRAVAFARHTADAIEQDILANGRRQRVNLGGSRTFGVEASGGWRRGALRVDASGTLLHLRGWDDGDASFRLPERPAALGRIAAIWLPPTGWTLAAEVLGTGPALSLGPGGPIDLPASTRLGARVGYRWAVGRGLLAAFARVDNATDALHLPQAGLPAPGREVRVGLRWVR